MKPCPVCKAEIKSRVNGACPNCIEQIELHDGVYYKAGVGSPTVAILHHFEELATLMVSKMLGKEINFVFNKKSVSYKREMVEAQRILKECEYDLILAFEALDVLFQNMQFSYKTRTSMIGIRRDMPMAMAIAKVQLQEKNKIVDQQENTFDLIMSKEDIFGG